MWQRSGDGGSGGAWRTLDRDVAPLRSVVGGEGGDSVEAAVDEPKCRLRMSLWRIPSSQCEYDPPSICRVENGPVLTRSSKLSLAVGTRSILTILGVSTLMRTVASQCTSAAGSARGSARGIGFSGPPAKAVAVWPHSRSMRSGGSGSGGRMAR
jgi:hypothetical protein